MLVRRICYLASWKERGRRWEYKRQDIGYHTNSNEIHFAARMLSSCKYAGLNPNPRENENEFNYWQDFFFNRKISLSSQILSMMAGKAFFCLLTVFYPNPVLGVPTVSVVFASLLVLLLPPLGPQEPWEEHCTAVTKACPCWLLRPSWSHRKQMHTLQRQLKPLLMHGGHSSHTC